MGFFRFVCVVVVFFWFGSSSALTQFHGAHFNARFGKRQAPVDYFSTHASSPNLIWYGCYDFLQCARLEVPVDYNNRHNKDTFTLAVVKVPASTQFPFKGTLFLSASQASNIDFWAQVLDPVGHQVFANLYGSSTVGEGYDIIFWDPRGSGHTTPQVNCFPNPATAAGYFGVEKNGLQLNEFNGTRPPTTANVKANIRAVSARQQSFSAGCIKYYGKYAPYMGSVDSARDLNHIVTLLGGTKLVSMYFFTYSTAMGLTYASMFPNGFDRMALDGVVDAQKLYKGGDNGPSTIKDAAKGEQVFFDSCSAAGPCPDSPNCCWFWAPTPAGVKARYQALKAKYYFQPFKSNPPNPTCGDCTTSYYTISTGLSEILEVGGFLIQFLSKRLQEWESGVAEVGGAIELFSTVLPDTVFWEQALRSVDQDSAIQTLENQVDYLIIMNKTSSQLGGRVANQELYAANWPRDKKLRNPFTGKIGGKTKGQMLFIGNTADPLNSLDNAKAMSALFPNSGVLTVNALGNSLIFLGQTQCTVGFVGPFFDLGTIPPKRSFCNDALLFSNPYVKDYR